MQCVSEESVYLKKSTEYAGYSRDNLIVYILVTDLLTIVIEMLTWQKESIGLRPQQSMTIMQNRYPGMSTITLHN